MVLKMMLKSAEQWGYIDKNPARFAERIRECHKEMEFLTPGEIRRFLSALPHEFYILFLTAIPTGPRQGELFGLKWMDFYPISPTASANVWMLLYSVPGGGNAVKADQPCRKGARGDKMSAL